VIGEIFTLILLNPLVNLLVLLSHVLFGSFGLAIIAFTILIRAATFPLTLRQIHATRTMQALQPRISEVNKKYSDPKRRQEEVMKLYREAGANPLSWRSSQGTSTAGATSSTHCRFRSASLG
jgi:YidC/Oxa1 family membrane protein insertase